LLARPPLFLYLTLGFGLLGKPSCSLCELTPLLPGLASHFACQLAMLGVEFLGATTQLLALGIREAHSFRRQPRVFTGLGHGLPLQLAGLIPELLAFGVG